MLTEPMQYGIILDFLHQLIAPTARGRKAAGTTVVDSYPTQDFIC